MIAFMNKLRDFHKDDAGQVFVLFLMVACVLVMMIGTVYNIGIAVGEKMKLQNLADSCAYSQAIWEARSYNYFAYSNRAMIAHFCTIAFCVAVDSSEKLWKDFANTIGNLPYIGPVIKVIYQFYQIADQVLNETVQLPKLIKEIWNPIYQTTQLTFFTSMRLSLLYADIPDDIVRRTEELNGEQHSIEINSVINANNIPGAGITNNIINFVQELSSLGMFNTHITPLNYINMDNYQDIVAMDGLLKFKYDFDKLENVIKHSLDCFAKGSDGPGKSKNFPRHLMFYIPPKWVQDLTGPQYGYKKFGLQGHYKIKKDKFYQEDGIMWKTYKGISIFGHKIGKWVGPYYRRTASFDYDLEKFRFPHMDKNDDIDGTASKRSVWILLRKPKESILKFPVMLGLEDFGDKNYYKDIYALSRAEVYYKNPEDENEKPTLFNAYWHAKLAPIYDSDLKYTKLEKYFLKYLQIMGMFQGGFEGFDISNPSSYYSIHNIFNFNPSESLKCYH